MIKKIHTSYITYLFDKNSDIIQSLLKEMAYWLKKSNDPWYQNNILNDWIDY